LACSQLLLGPRKP
jgi:transposase